ncbi:hypothetical protein [Cellulomonas composti]|nr:hypothetical protein [Cellulomonas composti]
MRPRRTLPVALALAVALPWTALSAADAATPPTTTTTGTLLEVAIDDHDAPTSTWVLEGDDGSLTEVKVPTSLRGAVGAPATVTLDTSTATPTVTAARPSTTLTPQVSRPTALHAYVVDIVDPTSSDTTTLAKATATTKSMESYWVREGKGGITSFDTTKAISFTQANACDMNVYELWAKAAAKFPGVAWGWANHLVVYLPSDCAYGWTGLATIGGGYMMIVAPDLPTTAHELGHNLGLAHSNLEIKGKTYEYFGAFGPMGFSVNDYAPGTLDAAYQEQLALPKAAAARRTLTWGSTTTVTIAAVGAGAVNSVKVTDPKTGTSWFFEYRAGRGPDAKTFYATQYPFLYGPAGGLVDYRRGVQVSNLTSGGLITHTTIAADETWAATRKGEWFVDRGKRLAMKVVSTTATAATVQIVTGGTGAATPPRWTREGMALPVVVVTPLATKVGQKARVNIRVIDASVGSSESYAVPRITIDGGTPINVKLDANGRATWTASGPWAKGSYPVQVYYPGRAGQSLKANGYATVVVTP